MHSDASNYHFFKYSNDNLQNVVVEGKNDSQKKAEPRPQTPTQVWQEFLDETSLLGIQRTFQKKSIFWLIASVLCMAMGIMQSWRVAQAYFGNKSLQRLLVVNKPRLPFPSVTVCGNVVLPPHFDLGTIPGYNTSIDKLDEKSCDSEEEQEAWEKVMEENDHKLIEYLRELPAAVRMNYSIPISEFLLSCKIGGKPCNTQSEEHFDVFNNALMGNCFTINPAFLGKGYEADVGDRLKLHLKVDSSGHRLHSGDAHLHLLIHAPGTAPIMTSPSVYDVYTSRHVTMAMRMSEKLFVALPSEDRKPCVELTNDEYRRRSIFYSDNSPYLYSLEACMATCEQKYYKENCGLIDATFPIQSAEYEKTVQPALPPVQCVIPDLDMNMCDCPIPCHVLQYAYVPDTTESAVPDCEKKEPEDDAAVTGDHDQPSVYIKHFRHHVSKVSIFFATNVHETTAEELEHSLSQFLGILGGNISLWAGICVLSLLEIVDFTIRWLIAICKEHRREEAEKTIVDPPKNYARKFHNSRMPGKPYVYT